MYLLTNAFCISIFCRHRLDNSCIVLLYIRLWLCRHKKRVGPIEHWIKIFKRKRNISASAIQGSLLLMLSESGLEENLKFWFLSVFFLNISQILSHAILFEWCFNISIDVLLLISLISTGTICHCKTSAKYSEEHVARSHVWVERTKSISAL